MSTQRSKSSHKLPPAETLTVEFKSDRKRRSDSDLVGAAVERCHAYASRISKTSCFSNVLLALQQLGLVGRAVVVQVALGGGDATVRHTDGFNLARRGDAGDAFVQRRAAALRAGRRAASAHQRFKGVAAGLAVVVVDGHGDLQRIQAGVVQRSVGDAQPSSMRADAGFVPSHGRFLLPDNRWA